jgi:hypothetical protein
MASSSARRLLAETGEKGRNCGEKWLIADLGDKARQPQACNAPARMID